MELGLFSPCCDVEKLPPSPLLGPHKDRRGGQKRVPNPLACPFGAKILFCGCFEWRQSPGPTQESTAWGLGQPLASAHPSLCFPGSQEEAVTFSHPAQAARTAVSFCGDLLLHSPQGISSFPWHQMTTRSSGSALMRAHPTHGWLRLWARYVPSSSGLACTRDARAPAEGISSLGVPLVSSMLISCLTVLWGSPVLS